jgi:trimethylamine--corrinoid protein Co-methyltransferase
MIINPLPHFEYLPAEDIETIHQYSLKLLAELGLEFLHPEAVALLEAAGAEVVNRETGHLRLPRELVLDNIAKAPSEFTLYARNPANNVVLGGRNIVCAPMYGSPFVHSLDEGRRGAVLKDFQNFVKLAQVTPQIHCAGGTVVEPEDEPQETRHLDMVYTLMTLSDKTYMGSVTSAANGRDTIEMAALAFGGKEAIAKKPVLLALVNVNSPRRYDTRMLEALLEYAKARQAVIVTPFILAGAMSPVALGGTLIQQNAEALAGVALTQLVNSGTPVIYGSFLSNTDMQSGSPAFGTPESAKALFVSAQLARRYHLPFRSGGGLTSSKLPDAQAAYEATMGYWPTFLAGTNFVLHAAGWLESGLVSSYEKFVLDVEQLRIMEQFFTGIPLDEEGIAWDAHVEVAPGGHFLGAEHTMRHFRTAFYRPLVSDLTNYERWHQKGALSADQRASRLWKKWLMDYEQPPVDPGVDESLREFIKRRKVEINEAG